MTEGWIAVIAAIATAIIGGIWAVASMMIAQLEKQITLMNRQLEKQIEMMDSGICTRMEDSEKARKQATEQWRGLFSDLRRQHREIAARLDHVEDRINQMEHIIHQCQGCHMLPSDLPNA